MARRSARAGPAGTAETPAGGAVSDILIEGEVPNGAVDWDDDAGPSPDRFLREIAPVDDTAWEDSLRRSLWTASARMTQAERVERIFLWGPEGTGLSPAPDHVTWGVLPPGMETTRRSASRFRLDVARPVPFDDLAVFERVTAPGEALAAPEDGGVW